MGKAVATDTLAEYKKAFNLFDKDGSGSIDSDELITVMKSLGVEATEEEVETMLETADADGSGEFSMIYTAALLLSAACSAPERVVVSGTTSTQSKTSCCGPE